MDSSRAGSVRMQEAPFWENVVRFMRFGISAVTGLIFGLLQPFTAFLRTPTLMAIGATLLLGVLVFFYLTLQGMQTTPIDIAQSAQSTLPSVPSSFSAQDPQMSRMLDEIYGR